MVQQASLPVGIPLRIDVTVGHQQIHPPVIVIVKKLRAPANIRKANLSDPGLERDVSKSIAALVVIENVVLVVEIGYEKIKLTVMIVVTQGNPHRTLLTTTLIDCSA